MKMNDRNGDLGGWRASVAALRTDMPAGEMRKSMTRTKGREDGATCGNHPTEGARYLLLRPHRPLAARQARNINGLIRSTLPRDLTCRYTPKSKLNAIALETEYAPP